MKIFAKNLIDFAVSPHNSKLLAFPAPFDVRKVAKEFRINGHLVQAFFWTFGKKLKAKKLNPRVPEKRPKKKPALIESIFYLWIGSFMGSKRLYWELCAKKANITPM